MKNIILLTLVLLISIFTLCTFATADNTIKIHLICHSHDDSGWLETFEEYYQDSVRFIISRVLTALTLNPQRKFNWSEIGFLERWWSNAFDEEKNLFKNLVREKRIEFINAGWVQNDEACATPEDVIRQLSIGHKFILENFGKEYLPESGWQIDPFGHSSLTPTIQAQMGYKNLVLNRINYKQKNQMKSTKNLQFKWRGNPTSLGAKSDIFAHALDDFYVSPPHFSFDLAYNVQYYRDEDLIQTMIRYGIDKSKFYKAPFILIPIGGDFNFKNAEMWFDKLDKVVNGLNKEFDAGRTNVKIQYSTLKDFFDETKEWLNKNNVPVNYYDQDFFPLADDERTYWTGYYTSRPLLKGRERAASSRLRGTEILASCQNHLFTDLLDSASKNISILQHHDAITGTSRQHVVDDYLDRMENTYHIMDEVTEKSMNQILKINDVSVIRDFLLDFKGANSIFISITNPLGWNVKKVVTFHIRGSFAGDVCPFKVRDRNGDIDIDCFLKGGEIQIAFLTEVHPLGSIEYEVKYVVSSDTRLNNGDRDGLDIKNKIIRVNLDPNSKLVKSIDLLKERVSVQINQNIMLYNDYGGAYIFRNEGPAFLPQRQVESFTVYSGKYLTDVMILYKDVFAHGEAPQLNYYHDILIRITNSNDKNLDKNIFFSINTQGINGYTTVNKFDTDIKNQDFYTDTGLQLMSRPVKEKTMTEYKNYYPTVNMALIDDKKRAFVCHNDRARGVSSISTGNLEFHLHRSLIRDDQKGLDIPAVDDSKINARFECYIDNYSNVLKSGKKESLIFQHPFLPFSSLSSPKASLNGLLKSLPENIHILSMYNDGFSYQIRIMNIRESGSCTTLDLLGHFGSNIKKIKNWRETDLSLIKDYDGNLNPILASNNGILGPNKFPIKDDNSPPRYSPQNPISLVSCRRDIIINNINDQEIIITNLPCPDQDPTLLPWSKKETWGDNGLPLQNSHVNITIPILLDIIPPSLESIYIFGNGKLVWKHKKNISLSTGAIIIWDGGQLIIGSEECKFRYPTSITLEGESIYTAINHSIDGHQFGQKVIGVGRGGTLELHGASPVVTWTKLNRTTYSENHPIVQQTRIITLINKVRWPMGSKVIFASTDFDENQAEENTIDHCPECKDNQIKVLNPLKYLHWGSITKGVDERGEVGILTRNIVIQGKLGQNCINQEIVCRFLPFDNFGGHIMILKGFTNAHIEGIELYHMGQSHILSRYPLHFHITGRVDKQGGYEKPAYIKKSVVNKSFSRCFVVHGTHGLLLSDNIGFDSIGHCFMMCDGIETMNSFIHNLGLSTKYGLLLPTDRNCEMCTAFQPHDFNGQPTKCLECNAVSTFWITNPNNTLIGNSAAGSVVTGIWYIFPDYPVGETSILGRINNVRPVFTRVLKFFNNVVHSNLDGIQIDGGLKTTLPSTEEPQQYQSLSLQRYRPRENSQDVNSNPASSLFTGIKSYKNRWRGGWARGGELIFEKCTFADNAIGLTIASEGTTPADPTVGQKLYNSIFVGETENDGDESLNNPKIRGRTNPFGENGLMPVRGFEVYDGTFHLENITFSNFKVDGSKRNISAIGFFRINDWQESAKSTLKNLRFINVDKKVHFEDTLVDGDKTSTILDFDGTLTKNANMQLVRNFLFYNTENCHPISAWNGLICKEEARQLYLCNDDTNNTRYDPVTNDTRVTLIRDKDSDLSMSLTGLPNHNPRNRFLFLVFKNYTYDFHFPHPTPKRLRIQPMNWEQGETITIGICIGIKKGMEINIYKNNAVEVYPIYPSNSYLVTPSVYYLNPITGMLYLQYYQENNRIGDNYCGASGCEEIIIEIDGYNAGKVTGDCQTSAYAATFSIFSDSLNKKFKTQSFDLGNGYIVYDDFHSYKGEAYLSYTPSNMSSLKFECKQCIPATGFKFLELWINGGDYSNQFITIGLLSHTSNIGHSFNITNIYSNIWTMVRIPFAAITTKANTSPYNGIIINSNSNYVQNPVFIDEINLIYDN
ncbi:hypothetical protein CYY_006907 [Polysphondylium violaceum]|uniref:alpha-mannosidase n=1 Tax=Polysphondylium violaceum TaxID=133409 RepID=A0A8J4PSP1_9MYCE|nr:hypothetical protein CYY_006907 [Polysphondylium violaceum]